MLAGARLRIPIDIGFGDVVTPEAQTINHPTLLGVPQTKPSRLSARNRGGRNAGGARIPRHAK